MLLRSLRCLAIVIFPKRHCERVDVADLDAARLNLWSVRIHIRCQMLCLAVV